MEVRPPLAGGGAFGMRTDQGVLCNKDLFAMYTASRAHDLLGDAKVKTVCEIGGGTGMLAYYLARGGMDEVWVFDLPIVSLVQAYYLMKSLGPDDVWLYGEGPRAARVRLLPYWEFENAPGDTSPSLSTRTRFQRSRSPPLASMCACSGRKARACSSASTRRPRLATPVTRSSRWSQ